MVTSPPPSPRAPAVWADRASLQLAAPLVGVGWLPWWSILGMILALVVTRSGEGARSVRVPLLLLGGALGLVTLLLDVGSPGGAQVFMQTFVAVGVGTALVALAVPALEEGQAVAAALWLGLLLLLGSVLGYALPGVGVLPLLLALLGGVGLEERPRARLPGRRAVLETAGVGVALAAVLAVLAFSLPQPTSLSGAVPSTPASSTRAPAEGAKRPQASAQAPVPTVQTASTRQEPPPDALPGTNLVLLGGLLFVLALAFAAWRAAHIRAQRRRLSWWEVAAVLSVLLGAALLFAYGLLVGQGHEPPPLAQSSTRTSTQELPPSPPFGETTQLPVKKKPEHEGLFWVLSLLTFGLFTALAGALFWLSRAPRPAPLAGPAPVEEAPLPGETDTLHRVRQAYRDTLTALAGVGLGRTQAETPAEHAARVGAQLPGAGTPLGVLVAAYAPVRYGGRVTEEDAGVAEEAARAVRREAEHGERREGQTP